MNALDLSFGNAGGGFDAVPNKMSFRGHRLTTEHPLVELGQSLPVAGDDVGMDEPC